MSSTKTLRQQQAAAAASVPAAKKMATLEDAEADADVDTRETIRSKAVQELKSKNFVLKLLGIAQHEDKNSPYGLKSYVVPVMCQALFAGFITGVIIFHINYVTGGFSSPGAPLVDRFLRALFIGLADVFAIVFFRFTSNNVVYGMLFNFADWQNKHFGKGSMMERIGIFILDNAFNIVGYYLAALATDYYNNSNLPYGGVPYNTAMPRIVDQTFLWEAFYFGLVLAVLNWGYNKAHSKEAIFEANKFKDVSNLTPNVAFANGIDKDPGEKPVNGVVRSFLHGKLHKQAICWDNNPTVLKIYLLSRVIGIFVLQVFSPTFLNFNASFGYALKYTSLWNSDVRLWAQLLAQMTGAFAIALHIAHCAWEREQRIKNIKAAMNDKNFPSLTRTSTANEE